MSENKENIGNNVETDSGYSGDNIRIRKFQEPCFDEFNLDISNMNRVQNRLRTFEKQWNKWFIDPLELSRAGFYYTKLCDHVKCFSCGGVLEDWNITDEIWEEHAFWFPDCQHVKNIKGNKFIADIRRKWLQQSRFRKLNK